MRYYTIFCWPKQNHTYCFAGLTPASSHRCLYLSIWRTDGCALKLCCLFIFYLCIRRCYTYGMKTPLMALQRGVKTVTYFTQKPAEQRAGCSQSSVGASTASSCCFHRPGNGEERRQQRAKRFTSNVIRLFNGILCQDKCRGTEIRMLCLLE